MTPIPTRLGRLTPQTALQIALLSQVTASDLILAQVQAHADLPVRLSRLLDATRETSG